MKTHLNSLFFLSIWYFNFSLYSSNFIYQISDGNLIDSWTFNFTIFATHFKGVILYSIDSGTNQLGLVITTESNADRSIRLNYNKLCKFIILKRLCGCDPCDGNFIHFFIELRNSMIMLSCNNRKTEVLSINGDREYDRDERSINSLYPKPVDISKASNQIYIMIANIGPYVSADNHRIFPLRDQMEGCVETFYYNNMGVTFIGNDIKVRTSCQNACNKETCHDGHCLPRMSGTPICDCSNAALNGPRCDKELMMYHQGNHSYERKKHIYDINFKLSWKTLFSKVYCLVEIESEHLYVTLYITKHYLKMNSTNVSGINTNGINFINVNINKGFLILKINNNESNVTFPMTHSLKILVGVSKNKDCQTFEGAYDIHYNSSQLQHIIPIQRPLSAVTEMIKQTVNTTQNNMNYANYIPISLGAAILIVIVLVCVTNLAIFMRLRNQPSLTHVTELPSNKTQVHNAPMTTETNGYSNGYSEIDYLNMSPTNSYEDQDSYGYIQPKHSETLVPELPPRNIT